LHALYPINVSAGRRPSVLAPQIGVGVDWIEAVPVAEAKRCDVMFADQNHHLRAARPKHDGVSWGSNSAFLQNDGCGGSEFDPVRSWVVVIVG
jgi:hypothetical protein